MWSNWFFVYLKMYRINWLPFNCNRESESICNNVTHAKNRCYWSPLSALFSSTVPIQPRVPAMSTTFYEALVMTRIPMKIHYWYLPQKFWLKWVSVFYVNLFIYRGVRGPNIIKTFKIHLKYKLTVYIMCHVV